ncbi:uncharacterized protein LOC131597130 [Vicia villosa]|uniref:uncharacterized protein LOC131597130 n=1 Tax=Vicia villosa TaxID=3911 RepID=UPI00273C30BB|nr:uncharacterized protein LOC131597130 [Vicia villosa]
MEARGRFAGAADGWVEMHCAVSFLICFRFWNVKELGEWVNNHWRWRIVECESNLTQVELEEWGELRQLLLDVAPKWREKDFFVWPLNGSGVFNVKDYYGSMVLEQTDMEEDPATKKAWSIVWKSWMPSKVKIFAWRLFKDRLATRVELVKRGIIENNNASFCVFGCQCQKNIHHLFLSCGIVVGVWGKVYQWLGIAQQVHTICCEEFLHMVGLLKRSCVKSRVGVIWVTVCWCIWKQRNDLIFNNGLVDLEVIVHKVKMFTWWWLAIGNKQNIYCNFYEWSHCPLDYL